MDFFYLLFQSVLISLLGLWHLLYPPKLKNLEGEIALITGAGQGIGRELALQLARIGVKVICLDNKENLNKETLSQVRKEGGTCWGFCCDVSRKEEVAITAKKIKEFVGDVSLIINNAGIMVCKPFLKSTTEEIERLFRVNVFAHFWILQEWLPTMMANRKGHIVGLSSVYGVVGAPNLVPYCSTKFAVRGLIEGLNEELRYGNVHSCIKLTRVHPFHIDSDLMKHKRIRFPSISPVISVKECAEAIVSGIRRNDEVIFIPRKDFYFFKFMELLPRGIQQAVLDFIDTGVDADEANVTNSEQALISKKGQ